MAYKRPESILVVIYARQSGRVLMLQRRDDPDFWQSVTGIAPFRAFIQQRAAEGAEGLNWLFFGNPHFTEDFLYQVEWQRFVKDGVLSRIDLAWSRDQKHKVYVQDKLREQGAEVWRWIEQGAHIYVCGDANRMAKDVDQALLELLAEHGGMDAEQAAGGAA